MQINNNAIASIQANQLNSSPIEQFEALWLAIQNAKNSSSQEAAEKALEAFLQNPANYQAVLEEMNEVGESPNPFDADPQSDLHGLFLALQTGNINDIDEFGQNVNGWMGMTLSESGGQWELVPISPETILSEFITIEEAYAKDPNFVGNQQELAWVLNPKYSTLLSQLSSDPQKFLKEAAQLQKDLKSGDVSKVKADLDQLMGLFLNQAIK